MKITNLVFGLLLFASPVWSQCPQPDQEQDYMNAARDAYLMKDYAKAKPLFLKLQKCFVELSKSGRALTEDEAWMLLSRPGMPVNQAQLQENKARVSRISQPIVKEKYKHLAELATQVLASIDREEQTRKVSRN